jgi:hypothetical protein
MPPHPVTAKSLEPPSQFPSKGTAEMRRIYTRKLTEGRRIQLPIAAAAAAPVAAAAAAVAAAALC